jgi:4'-phosphopantetheinyl transferase
MSLEEAIIVAERCPHIAVSPRRTPQTHLHRAAALHCSGVPHFMPLSMHAEPWQAAEPPAVARLLGVGQAHLWLLPLDRPPVPVADLVRVLSPEEHDRAARFHFIADRRRFEAGRGLLRAVLGHYLGAAPAGLRFVYGPYGKPALRSEGAGQALEFNLSHCGGWALLGVTRGAAIGVDLEVERELPDHADIARSNFAPAERAELLGLPPAERLAGFFATWTRKEAYVKAIGDGLTVRLDQFEVSVHPSQAATLRSVAGSEEAARGWTLWSAKLSAEAWGAVAVHGAEREILRFSWA